MPASSYLADTNVLLRVSQRQDPSYDVIRTALSSLRADGAKLCFTSQNLAEFWNVCTRPAAHNGYGLSIAETDRRAELIEAGFMLLADAEEVHAEWRRLVVIHSVIGVKVHDARLVAAMRVHGITHILTLDNRDFHRYTEITVVHPRELTKST
jgi:predicted nucleic acid-binding protein